MNTNCTIKELPEEARPYEKCLKYGAKAMTNAELLAIIIRTGTKGIKSLDLAEEILSYGKEHTGLLMLQHLSVNDLLKIKGIGRVKALQIKCIAELSNRIAKTTATQSLMFDRPATIANYYMEELRHKEREQLVLIMLNTKNKFLNDMVISTGTINSSLVSPREIFVEALKYNTVNIILVHNHPSGDPTPSKEDMLITKRIKEAGEMVGICLLDHLVIGDNCYMSFNEKGML
jgi:DNA repair protein radc